MSAAASARPRWSLQRRLMVAVIGIVSLIFVSVALATGTILERVLQDNLTATLDTTAQRTGQTLLQLQFGPPGPAVTATDVLDIARAQPGAALVLRTPAGTTEGAYVSADNTILALTADQVSAVVEAMSRPGTTRVDIDGIGAYQVQAYQAHEYVAVAGLPLREVQATVAQIVTTMVLVTTGGLLLLAAVIALVIRVGLRPLRNAADTATRVAAVPMSQGAVSITERVPEDETDEHTEIGRVGHALNTLLDHVDASLDARQRNEERMRRFVADASHELRTPLASIRGYSELSLRDPTLSETSGSALERIQAQSLRMTALVEDLLLLARLDEGRELVYGAVDLSRLAIEAVGDARPAGPDHAWVLDVGEEPVVIAGDAHRLHQVAANLLANARTHTPAGATVTVTVAREGADAVLRVHDDGPGIDPSIADELFERFSRADDSRARQTGGTGLGLSIARAIVEAHRGSLTVRSDPGDTTFEVRLPARPAEPGEPGVSIR